MEETVLIYIEQNHKYLMLYRNKKEKDINKLKWIGIGGHIEKNETPLEAVFRETKEETGLVLLNAQKRGVIHFRSGNTYEIMHLFTSCSFKGKLIECDEGELHWIDISMLENLPMWEGDKIFLDLLKEGITDFELSLTYEGDKLIESKRIK